jgi:hypothetical protein
MVPLGEQNSNNEGSPFAPMAFQGVQGIAFANWIDISYSRNYMMGTQVPLVRPSRKSQSVKSIKGTIMTTILIDQKPEIVIDNVLKSKGKQFKGGPYTWTMDDVGQVNNNGGNQTYRVKFNLSDSSKKNNPEDNSWINSLAQQIELMDAKGNKFQVHGTNWNSASGANAQGEFTYGDPGTGKVGPPVKLVLYRWVSIQHPVPFEFRDLPLP